MLDQRRTAAPADLGAAALADKPVANNTRVLYAERIAAACSSDIVAESFVHLCGVCFPTRLMIHAAGAGVQHLVRKRLPAGKLRRGEHAL